jgi:hypothetical protein
VKKVKAEPCVSVPFSTTLTRDTKNLLERSCKRRGLRMNHLVEEALLAYLEDEMDSELIEERVHEETVPFRKKA